LKLTIKNNKNYYRHGAKDLALSLSPARGLPSSLSLPNLGPIGLGLTLPTKSVVKLPAIDPVLQSAGL